MVCSDVVFCNVVECVALYWAVFVILSLVTDINSVPNKLSECAM